MAQIEDEHLGELTYDLPLYGHRSQPITGNCAADVQQAIDVARKAGARNVRWSRYWDAECSVEAASLKDLGK